MSCSAEGRPRWTGLGPRNQTTVRGTRGSRCHWRNPLNAASWHRVVRQCPHHQSPPGHPAQYGHIRPIVSDHFPSRRELAITTSNADLNDRSPRRRDCSATEASEPPACPISRRATGLAAGSGARYCHFKFKDAVLKACIDRLTRPPIRYAEKVQALHRPVTSAQRTHHRRPLCTQR